MSSTMRESARAAGEASVNGIVRRMVSLPRSIIGGFSRVMNHGIDLMGMGGRRNQFQHLPPNFQPQLPSQGPLVIQEEWAFLTSFQEQYGSNHPFFYACRLSEALKMAEDEHKFMFMYLHSPEHPFTPSFCRETLGSELVVQFLDANFVSWGALASQGEGMLMAATMQPASFPFCAVVSPAPGSHIEVLQQMEGPVSPTELVEILQRTLEEQGLAFSGARAKKEERIRARVAKEEESIRADRELRQEQDAAYIAALNKDKEKEKHKNLHSEERVQKPVQTPNKANKEKLKSNLSNQQYGKAKETNTTREAQHKDIASRWDPNQLTKILFRFPNGERREQSFSCTDKVQLIFRYIDSLGLPGIGNYRLVSSFPRRVYGVDQMGMTLKDAGLHPRASLFLELL